MIPSLSNKKKVFNEFKNRTFVLTGYSKGIGRQVYENLNSLGSNLILIGRKKFKNKKENR